MNSRSEEFIFKEGKSQDNESKKIKKVDQKLIDIISIDNKIIQEPMPNQPAKSYTEYARQIF